MKCEFCNKESEVVNGTLEGVSFVPETQDRKWIKTGICALETTVCADCGRILTIKVNKESLKGLL